MNAPAGLFADPNWYLHRIDPVAGLATFAASGRERLVSTTFLDGRQSFSSGEQAIIPLSELAVANGLAKGFAPRVIMHMSFCGSTQLAHLMDASGAALALKEPHALVDLADWRRAMVEQLVDDARFGPVLMAAIALLSRRWGEPLPTVLKASNWANNLLPEILRETGARVLLVSIDQRSFLRAVFRGGSDRMVFTARAAAHLATATGRSALLEQAIASATNPLDQVARIALVLHAIQERLFIEALNREPGRCGQIDYATLLRDPAKALIDSASVLQIDASAMDISNAVARRSAMDSKNPGHGFRRSDQDREAHAVEVQHGPCFDRAMDWQMATLDGLV